MQTPIYIVTEADFDPHAIQARKQVLRETLGRVELSDIGTVIYRSSEGKLRPELRDERERRRREKSDVVMLAEIKVLRLVERMTAVLHDEIALMHELTSALEELREAEGR